MKSAYQCYLRILRGGRGTKQESKLMVNIGRPIALNDFSGLGVGGEILNSRSDIWTGHKLYSRGRAKSMVLLLLMCGQRRKNLMSSNHETHVLGLDLEKTRLVKCGRTNQQTNKQTSKQASKQASKQTNKQTTLQTNNLANKPPSIERAQKEHATP